MAISRATGVLAVTASVMLAGCGAGRSARPPAGRTVFAQDCTACHSLTGTENPRLQGGDLLSFRSSRAELTELAGEMPVRRALNRSELRSVVSFVMSAENRQR